MFLATYVRSHLLLIGEILHERLGAGSRFRNVFGLVTPATKSDPYDLSEVDPVAIH